MPKEWWKSFFNEDYIRIWGGRGSFKHTKQEISFLEKIVPLKKNQRILDLCCGHGRHSLELARRGYNVTGVDFSRYELDLAKKAADKAGLKIRFIRGDARKFRSSKKFDVILNLFTAFGYGSEEDDAKILYRARENLITGGRFVIDYMNAFWLWRNYKPIDKWRSGKLLVKSERNYNFMANVNEEKLTIIRPAGQKIYRHMRLRIYSLADFRRTLENQGFSVKKALDPRSGRPVGFDSRRILILAEKK